MVSRNTLAREFSLDGVGVHSGKPVRLALVPSEAGSIVFRRSDLGGRELPLAAAGFEALNSTTIVGERFKVRTVEHLLATLFANGVGSAVVVLDADEVPIMDGSARPFVRALEEAGTCALGSPCRGLRISRPFAVFDGGASIVAEPPSGEGALDLSYAIEYPHPAIGRQSRSVRLTPGTFAREIAPARTFGFLADVEELRRRGLALGASYENTVVLDAEAVINGPLRFPDEFVRHKLLDLAGDLALLGRPLAGRITAFKAGHRLHLEAVKFLLANPDFTEPF
jgi:UDP-3-O-[3-hydroxymyristoyl] N-acetylglucosamine deacetylase